MMASTTDQKLKKYICKLCGVSFTSEFCHFLHLHVHADDSSKLYKFHCESCDKKFKKASQLKCHKTTCRAGTGGEEERASLPKSTSLKNSSERKKSGAGPKLTSLSFVKTVNGVRRKYQKALSRGKQQRTALKIKRSKGFVIKSNARKNSDGLNAANEDTTGGPPQKSHAQLEDDRKQKQKELLQLVKWELANNLCGDHAIIGDHVIIGDHTIIGDHVTNDDGANGDESKEEAADQPQKVARKRKLQCEEGEIKEKKCKPKLDPDDTGPPYMCTDCNKEFAKRRYLTRHQAVHTGEKPYICAICFKAFALKVTLSRHWRIHSGEKPFQCEICDKTFNRRSNLSIHKRIHEGVRPFKCDVESCEKDFTQKSQLIAHALTHTDERPFQCEECQKTFKSPQQLEGHKAMVHSDTAKHSCDLCGKGFPSANYLRVHRAFHTGDKPFQCEQCSKGFTIRHDLTRHMRVHSGIKPFKCEHCGFEVSRKSALVTHRRCHTGEKPYKCDTCGKEFARNDTLVNHSRIHTGEKPHKCDICGKEFSLRSNLLHHLKTHSKEKPVKPRRPPVRRPGSITVDNQVEHNISQELIVPGHVIQGLLEIGNIAQLSLQTSNVHQTGNVEQYQVITANILDNANTNNREQGQPETITEEQQLMETVEQTANETEQQPQHMHPTQAEIAAALQSLQALHAGSAGGIVETTDQGHLRVRSLGNQESIEMTVALQSLGVGDQMEANVDMMDHGQIETITVDKDTLETLLSVFIPGLMAGSAQRTIQGESSIERQPVESQLPLIAGSVNSTVEPSIESQPAVNQCSLENSRATDQSSLGIVDAALGIANEAVLKSTSGNASSDKNQITVIEDTPSIVASASCLSQEDMHSVTGAQLKKDIPSHLNNTRFTSHEDNGNPPHEEKLASLFTNDVKPDVKSMQSLVNFATCISQEHQLELNGSMATGGEHIAVSNLDNGIVQNPEAGNQ